MLTFITFPTDFASSTLDIAGQLVGDLSTPMELIIGVLLAVVVVAVLIGILVKH